MGWGQGRYSSPSKAGGKKADQVQPSSMRDRIPRGPSSHIPSSPYPRGETSPSWATAGSTDAARPWQGLIEGIAEKKRQGGSAVECGCHSQVVAFRRRRVAGRLGAAVTAGSDEMPRNATERRRSCAPSLCDGGRQSLAAVECVTTNRIQEVSDWRTSARVTVDVPSCPRLKLALFDL